MLIKFRPRANSRMQNEAGVTASLCERIIRVSLAVRKKPSMVCTIDVEEQQNHGGSLGLESAVRLTADNGGRVADHQQVTSLKCSSRGQLDF